MVREFIFKNYRNQIDFAKGNNFYSLKKNFKKDSSLFGTNLTKRKYMTLLKLEEHYELFLEHIGWKNHKASKTVKSPNYVDIKLLLLHILAASNFLKSVTQKIITQEMQTVEKSNIFVIGITYYRTLRNS